MRIWLLAALQQQITKRLGEWERILEGAVEHRRRSGAAVAGLAG